MITEDRINEILKLLNKNGKVLVKNLSKKFNVSEDLIRKDLKKLEKNEEVRRVYGGAVLRRDNFIDLGTSNRKTNYVEEKKTIAEKALEIINDNENIFLGISTTNLLLANLIAESNKKITVISNMPDIIKILGKNDNINIIGIGGTYNAKAEGYLGSAAIDQIKNYRVDKCFIGCCGVNLVNDSVMTVYLNDGITKQHIIEISKHSYLLMENKKFTKEGLYKYSHLDEIEGIITESKPDPYIVDLLKEKEVSLI